jgi:glucuronokinase
LIIEERAYARAGFLGNPSDGYFGKTISISVKNFGAHISLYESPELVIEAQPEDTNTYNNMHSLVERIKLHGYYGGDRLIKAAIKKFFQYCQDNSIQIENKNFTIRYRSNIPRQVGLAGSSAIITATMKALLRFYGVKVPKEMLPTLILNAEVDELGINAGLQDRVIQVFQGCVFMDFEKVHVQKYNYGQYEAIDPKRLSNLYIAYKTELSKVSGAVLNDIRARYDKGDKDVINTLSEIGNLAVKGKDYIKQGKISELKEIMDINFNLRSKIMDISDSNKELVTTARACGASAKFAGSGGSIIGIYDDNEMLTRLIVEMKKIKARVIKPYIL